MIPPNIRYCSLTSLLCGDMVNKDIQGICRVSVVGATQIISTKVGKSAIGTNLRGMGGNRLKIHSNISGACNFCHTIICVGSTLENFSIQPNIKYHVSFKGVAAIFKVYMSHRRRTNSTRRT